MPLEPFRGALGSSEHIAWSAEAAKLQKAYSTRRARYARKIGRPYPNDEDEVRPPPGTVDAVAVEEG